MRICSTSPERSPAGRTLLVAIAFAALALCSIEPAQAQTLSEQLLKENPTSLAAAARQRGNIVRGAILFHQGNIQCAKCHQASEPAKRIGPDLSRMDPKATDGFLVESILSPSKVIHKDFQSKTIVTVGGRLLSGLIIASDPKRIVLRDLQNSDLVRQIDREQVMEIRENKTSIMPSGLADQIKSRQQFLDLVRYVIDVRERGPQQPIAKPTATERRQLRQELTGLVAIKQRNCAACHALDQLDNVVPAKSAPRLNWSAMRKNPEQIERFIASPQTAKPGATMPHLLDHVDEAERITSANALTHYIMSTANRKNSFSQAQKPSTDSTSITRGHRLFHSVGCVACHAPRDEDAKERDDLNESFVDSIPLGDISFKYRSQGLIAFLKDPHAARPSGRMPNMQLTHREAVDVTTYLLQKAEPRAVAWKVDDGLAQTGKKLFSQLRCVRCHSDPQSSESPKNPEEVELIAISSANSDRGCLSGKAGSWPTFHFADGEREAIRATLKRESIELSGEDRIRVTMATFNCVACHQRGDFGGVTDHRKQFFQTTNMNLGEQGRIPPTLSGVGAKLKSKWMRDVLVNHRTIRPYMKTRMPQFGEENVGKLISLFESTDQLAPTTFPKFRDQKEMRKQGLELAGNRGLNCIACHTYRFRKSDTMPAVDLTEMAERLKKDWFHQYMLRPQSFSPNTVMPSFWPNGKAIRADLEGTPQDQIAALWLYLLDGRQARPPEGVIREPLEIVVTDEARMLRRRYPGMASKRGIGVGYPGGINIAYDAEQMRLAMIWNGKFADPGGVWYGQGHGTVRPMGQPVNLTTGPELVAAPNTFSGDPDARPPSHQFKGYELDSQRRPAFLYECESIQVRDYFTQQTDTQSGNIVLRREVVLTSPQNQTDVSFRLGPVEDTEVLSEQAVAISKRLTIRIVSDHHAERSQHIATAVISIPISLEADVPHRLVLEYRFD